MYELFILGKLMHRTMHGYLLQSVINAALGPFRRLSWGTLYPLLRKLEQDGLLAVQGGDSGDQRGTRNYRTTPLGRKRFSKLMRSPPDYEREYRNLFRIKLSNFGHVEKEERNSIVREYRDFLARIVKHSDTMSGEVRKAPGMASAERPWVLKAIDHQYHLAVSEIAWVDAFIKTMGRDYAKSVDKTKRVVSRSGSNRRSSAGPRSRSLHRK